MANLFIFSIILSITLILFSLHKQNQPSSSILQDPVIEKSDYELGSKDEHTEEIKKMTLEKQEIITSKQKNDPNEEWIPTLEYQLLNFISNLGNHLVSLTFKISEAFVLTINTLVTIVEKLPRFAIQFIKEPYKCVKPYIIQIIKTIMRLLVGVVKVLARLAIIVIRICMQLFIGLVKILASLATLVIKIIMWLLTELVKGINELCQLCFEVAR